MILLQFYRFSYYKPMADGFRFVLTSLLRLIPLLLIIKMFINIDTYLVHVHKLTRPFLYGIHLIYFYDSSGIGAQIPSSPRCLFCFCIGK